MKTTAINLRPGNVIDYNNKLWVVVKKEDVHPGKGNSVSQIELRDIISGTKDNVRFRTQETVEKVRLEQDDFQFLYQDDDGYHFMNTKLSSKSLCKKTLLVTRPYGYKKA